MDLVIIIIICIVCAGNIDIDLVPVLAIGA